LSGDGARERGEKPQKKRLFGHGKEEKTVRRGEKKKKKKGKDMVNRRKSTQITQEKNKENTAFKKKGAPKK